MNYALVIRVVFVQFVKLKSYKKIHLTRKCIQINSTVDFAIIQTPIIKKIQRKITCLNLRLNRGRETTLTCMVLQQPCCQRFSIKVRG